VAAFKNDAGIMHCFADFHGPVEGVVDTLKERADHLKRVNAKISKRTAWMLFAFVHYSKFR
jgi:hypothetical protein